MIPLIDLDIVAYRVAATVPEYDPFDVCQYRIDVLLRSIFENCESEEYIGVLSGVNNFRYKVYPEYKANRRDMIEPFYRKECKQYLIDNYHAVTTEDCEADDMLGWLQTKDTIICSIDKDLKQIPGKHYNFVKFDFDEVDKADGIKFFWKQMLIGDSSDNIKGVPGIGPKKADKYIDPCESEQECLDRVWELYNGDFKAFISNAQCLWIMRKEKETWVEQVDLILPDQLKQEADRMLEFMTSMKACT